MMKIVDFAAYYPPHIGGMEKYAEELHEHFEKRGCYITVFTPHLPTSSPSNETKGNIRILRYPAFDIIFNYPLPKIWKREFWEQWKEINNQKYDVVISTLRFFIQPLMGLLFARHHKIPLLHIEHCSDYVKNTFIISTISRLVDMTIGRFTLSHADTIVTPSQSAARFVKKLSGKNSTLIYRGMPLKEIDAILPDNEIRAQVGTRKIITYVGRLIYGKGVIHLLEAIATLNRSDVFVVIAGDGPEREVLEQYAQEHELINQILFLGNIPFRSIIGLFKVTDIFVNPSYNEGLPTSVLEASACRRAVIATNVGGTPEILTHNQSGIIIPPYSTEAIKNSLKELLDNELRRQELGKNARQEIEQKFNWDHSIEKYLKEISSLSRTV
jgi:glycosyltransferase involved in cell wall biosynthesis